jgi:predicted MFS family arabinose efflux permease
VWAVFAACAVLATVWAAATLPRGRLGAGTALPRLRFSWFVCPRSGPLLGASFLIGLGAAPFWTFAVDYVVRQEVLSPSGGRLFYAAVGLAGFAGAIAGDLVTRYPMRVVFASLAGAIAASFVLLAFAGGALAAGISGVLFGAAYIAILGVITIWSTEVFGDRPSAGLSASMFVMGAGLLTGPALAGAAAAQVGMRVVLLLAAAVIVAAAFLTSGTTLATQRRASPGSMSRPGPREGGHSTSSPRSGGRPRSALPGSVHGSLSRFLSRGPRCSHAGPH